MEFDKDRLNKANSLNIGGDPGNTRASLNIYGDDLDPHWVSSLLGCEATHAQRKGELDPDMPRRAPAVTGFWILDTPDELDLLEKIDCLLDSTTGEPAVWDALAECHEASVRVAVFLCSWNERFSLQASVLEKFAKRRWGLELSMYSAEGEEILEAFLRNDSEDEQKIQ